MSVLSVQQIKREVAGLKNRPSVRFRFWTLMSRLVPEHMFPSVRAALYRLAGCPVERGVALQGYLYVTGTGDLASRLRIGKGTYLAPRVSIGLDAPVTIGRNVSISPHVILHTGNHPLGFGSRRMCPKLQPLPIKIDDGAWVAMGAMILPGVTIGKGAVVSAGAVVTKDVPPHTLVSGNPAAPVRELPFADR